MILCPDFHVSQSIPPSQNLEPYLNATYKHGIVNWIPSRSSTASSIPVGSNERGMVPEFAVCRRYETKLGELGIDKSNARGG